MTSFSEVNLSYPPTDTNSCDDSEIKLMEDSDSDNLNDEDFVDIEETTPSFKCEENAWGLSEDDIPEGITYKSKVKEFTVAVKSLNEVVKRGLTLDIFLEAKE